MKAPKIKHWIRVLRGGKSEFDEETRQAIDRVFEQIQRIEPSGEYQRREVWLLDYPNEIEWIHLLTIENKDYRAIYLGRELIYQSQIYESHEPYECTLKELFSWIGDALKNSICEMQRGLYNEDVSKNLAVHQRTGTIARKDYWELFPNVKTDYLSDITQEEINFLSKI